MQRINSTLKEITNQICSIDEADVPKYMNKTDITTFNECREQCARINAYHERTGSPYRVSPRRVEVSERAERFGNRYSFEPRSKQTMGVPK